MISKLKLQSFRKYDNISLDLNHNLIILTGKNACGKSTILESIFLCSTSKSYRTNDFREMIKNDKEFSKIEVLNDSDRFNIILSKKGKRMLINSNEIKKISEFIGTLKVVMFSPTDMNLIIGEKSLRRNFFDLEISLIDKQYINHINEFKKLLKARNDLLKQTNIDDILLDTITIELIEREKYIMRLREKFIFLLNEELSLLDNKISLNEKIRINYLKSITGDLVEFYESKKQYDKITKMTNYGIHRDDYIFFMNDNLAKSYCSQGQLRTIAIALKIALFNLIKKITKGDPILLLDDVFSELDISRQQALVSFLTNKPQTFITTTNLLGLPKEILDKAYIINLEE